MRVDPILAELRADPGKQRAGQRRLAAQIDAWRNLPEVAHVLDEVDRYGNGAALADCPRLVALTTEIEAATAFAGQLVSTVIAAMRDEPMATIPMRYQYTNGYALVQLASRGSAALSLAMHDQAAFDQNPAQVTVAFVDCEHREICLTGGAMAQIVSRRCVGEGADFTFERLIIEPGTTHFRSGAHSARILEAIEGRMVALRLSRTPENPQPSREYRIASGELVHRASGNLQSSRDLMAIMLLGRMKRTDTAALLASRVKSGDVEVRWQALRECIALDTATGFAVLCEIAADASDPLAPPSARLQAQLVRQYPQLAELEQGLCHA